MVNTKTKEIKVIVPNSVGMYDLLGYRDELLKIIESEFKSRILVRGNEITISGRRKEARIVEVIFKELFEILAALLENNRAYLATKKYFSRKWFVSG